MWGVLGRNRKGSEEGAGRKLWATRQIWRVSKAKYAM